MLRLHRIAFLARSLLVPYTGAPSTHRVVADNQPVVPAADAWGVLWSRPIGSGTDGVAPQQTDWSISAQPAVNSVASITRAAVAGTSHVCTSINATISNDNAAATAILQVYLRDGASGVGPIIWSANIQCGPNTGQPMQQISISSLHIEGTAGNDMTLEFSAAGGLNTQENVSLTGYDKV